MDFTFYSVTAKRLELARNAALKRFRKNVDGAIVLAAAKMPMDFGDLKDGPRPPGEVFIERLIDFWNRQVDAIDGRLSFPIRMERTGPPNGAPYELAPGNLGACGRDAAFPLGAGPNEGQIDVGVARRCLFMGDERH